MTWQRRDGGRVGAAEGPPVGSTTTRPAGAEALNMTPATVKTHVSHILTRLDLDNRTQIALLAHDAGLA